MAVHIGECPFEPIKDVLEVSQQRMASLELELQQKDAEIGFLRSMLSKVSERLDVVEKHTQEKLGLSTHNSQLSL